jgi:hypothetical protein
MVALQTTVLVLQAAMRLLLYTTTKAVTGVYNCYHKGKNMTEQNTKVLKLSVAQLTRMEPALNDIARMQGLPQKTAYRFGRLITKTMSTLQEYNVAKTNLLNMMGKPQQEVSTIGAPVTYEFETPEKQKAYLEEHESLLQESFVWENWRPLTLDDFRGPCAIQITPMQWSLIEPLMDENAGEELEETDTTIN